MDRTKTVDLELQKLLGVPVVEEVHFDKACSIGMTASSTSTRGGARGGGAL